jgi:formate hydrogenlyase subunit 3/multisubunit Na+/H+ antiporter MnhD subunit
MFGSTGFQIILLLSLLVFAVPVSLKYYFTLGLLVAGILLTTVPAAGIMAGSGLSGVIPLFNLPGGGGMVLVIDSLSAFFILVINLTALISFLYAPGYLAPYREKMNSLRFSIHYFSFLWLWLSMLLVVMVRDGVSFLIVWEIMALSSFFLVIFDAEDRSIMKTGINYLIQMHVGMFFIMAAFLLVQKATGRMSFDTLGEYFAHNRNLPLFLLFFTGFAIKAGLIPFHTWLPDAHPAAPSHVSGLMSGVMIKMGIYGMVRVVASMQSDLLVTSVIILVVSLLSGVMGVMMAITQKDLKRMLAYSTIENAGIIGIGLGLGLMGRATGNPSLELLGYSGALLHILNHSLFKSLLFYSAGSVYHATHTRNMEQTGGLMKKMPWTAMLFLTGSLAICGLPPFNGFVSEYLIYMGMFTSLSGANLLHSILIAGSIAGLSLIGGLAIFSFSKAFGIVFLGQPRSEKAVNAGEVPASMIIPQAAVVILILFIGFGSPLVIKPLFDIVIRTWNIPPLPLVSGAYAANLTQISLAAGFIVITIAVLLLLRRYTLSHRTIETGPTWGCGYTATGPGQQYTSTSFAYNFNHIAKPVLQTRKEIADIADDEIFPGKRKFASHSDDFFRKTLVDRPVNLISGLLKRIAVMQTGQIRHYILYAFVFMLIVLLLALLNII